MYFVNPQHAFANWLQSNVGNTLIYTKQEEEQSKHANMWKIRHKIASEE